MRKTRVLLVVSSFNKAEGQMAKAIVKLLPKIDFFFFSVLELKYRRFVFEELLKSVDAVHWLINRNNVKSEILNLTRNHFEISTVHHVCEEETDKVESAKEADRIHVVSDEWESELKEKYNLKTEIVKASLGVHEPAISLKKKTYSNSNLKIGMMGFYPGTYNRKRPEIAFDALSLLSRTSSNFSLLLQGAGWSKYNEVLEELGVEYEILEYSSKNESDLFFDQIDIFLCTSDYEGGPLPVLEALSFGIPVISTKVGLAYEAISKGGGILVDKGDVIQIANSLIRLLKDDSLRKDLGKEAKKISGVFEWKNFTDQYSSLYKNIPIQNKRKNPSPHSIKQQEIELSYSNIQEGFSLLYHGKQNVGLRMIFSSLIDPNISFSRKFNTSKRLANFYARGLRS